MEFGAIALIPVGVTIICAILTKRAAESLFVGSIIAAIIFAIGNGGSWYSAFWTTVVPWDWANGTGWFDVTISVIGSNAYFIVLFGLFGGMIRILDQTGAAEGFAGVAVKLANTRKKTLLVTFALGVIIFVDDYLNAFGVGVAMRKISDKLKISREFLAYVINSTGAAVCILVPVSTWAAVYAGNIDVVQETESIFATPMKGFDAYVSSIPFMVYSWLALIVTLLFIFKVIPVFGAMKKAEERAATTGKVFPEWHYEELEKNPTEAAEEEQSNKRQAGWYNFLIPMFVIILVVIIQKFIAKVEIDLVLALIVSILVAAVMLLCQKKLKISEFCDSITGGFQDMAYVTILVLLAFTLQSFNDMLGLTPWVIESVTPILSPALLPVVVFIIVGALAFATGSFWGVAAISFPIVLPLATAMDVNIFLTIGTIAGATAFGSHACFYSDAVTVTAAATGIKNIDYAKTAIPMILVGTAVSIVAYLILGFVMAP